MTLSCIVSVNKYVEIEHLLAIYLGTHRYRYVVFVPYGASLHKLFMFTLKTQNNGPLYISTVIGTLAVDGWAFTFGTARRGSGRAGAPSSPLFAVPNVIAHPSTASK